jgi:hypothetical protein
MIFRTSAKFAVAMIAVAMLAPQAHAQTQQHAKPINLGEVLTGELVAMRNKRKKTVTYQVTSEPRRLPGANGSCGLETGPETFQIVTTSDAEAATLKPYLGKHIALRAAELSCSSEAGQLSDAVVTKWSVVKQ